MGLESVAKRKADLRRVLLQKRRHQSPGEKHRKSSEILQNCRSLDVIREAPLVCSYISFGEEVETESLVRSLLRERRRVAVPTQRTETGNPAFSEIRHWEELSPNSLGIMEPARDFLRLLTVDSIPLFLVPGVGFDLSGARLGYGLGFYDRGLSGCSPEAVRIGLAFELQIVPQIPVASHDLGMDIIVTENRVIETKSLAKPMKEVR